MSFTESAAANADVFVSSKVKNQNLAHTVRVIPYVEAYADQNRIGPGPIDLIQRAFEDDIEIG